MAGPNLHLLHVPAKQGMNPGPAAKIRKMIGTPYRRIQTIS